MADYDTSVRVKVSADNSELQETGKSFDNIAKSAENAKKKLEGDFNSLSDAVEDYKSRLEELRNKGFGPGNENYDQLYIAWRNAADAEREYLSNLDKMTDKGIAEAAEKAAKEAEKQAEQQRKIEEIAERNLQRENKLLEVQAAKEAKIKAEQTEQQRLEQIRLSAVVSNQNLVDLLNEQRAIMARMADLKKAGVAEGYKEYDALNTRLSQINTEIRNVRNGFDKVSSSGNKCLNILQKGTKNTNGLFATLASRLKGIALSLLVFNWITKGFNAMVSAMKEGFKNLAQYSSDYNNAMSDLKSECAELKNSLAVAFEPVATAIIPYITQLISWLNIAANSVSRFLAVISGKSTYTRAKKQVVDYAKSLKAATNSAKGALAAFDSINVLSKNESGGAGGELTGADAFETVNVTEEDYAWLDLVKEKLHEILGILIAVGFAMAVFGISGPVLAFVAVLALVLGLLEFIVQYMDAWANGISFDNLHGMLQGLLAVLLAIWVLFGQFAAGLALIAGGIALVVLAIKDMLENGLSAQNCFALLIGVVAVLAGIFMAFGSTAAMVVGGIAAVIGVFAALIAIAGNGEEAIATLKSAFKNFSDFFKKIFAGDIEGAMESLKAASKDLMNVLIISFESLINCIIKGLNWLIEKINSISFDVPDWVPVIGGKSLSPNIPTVEEVSLPRLATGGIVDRPTKAIFGEAGREAVLPLENNTGWMDDLADKLAARMPVGNSGPVYMQIDGKTFARLEMPYLKQENSRVGVSFKTGDVL